MGIGRNWTQEEYDRLKDLWGDHSIPSIAKMLDRSANAVKIKVARLGLGPHRDGGYLISLNCLLKTIGLHHNYSYIKMRLLRDGFPVKKRRVDRCRFLMVDLDEFWEWVDKHRDAVSFADFEPLALGAEPEWAKEKRRADYTNSRGVIKTPWTLSENDRLRRMLAESKYSYADIATSLRRTEGAIKRRISTLGLEQRPVKQNPRHWAQEEVDTLLTLKKHGYDYEFIGKRLVRTALACRGRFERECNPGFFDRDERRAREKSESDFVWTSPREFLNSIPDRQREEGT